ncbi:hypothetical protein FRC08_000840 [Ceratobasidium sp. 394]|nr:hypothetical protein FRC08_000840 [Ceratobasidium sp. 394]
MEALPIQPGHTIRTTPPTHVFRGSQVDTDTKDRLRETAPDGARCLITLDQEALDCCHVIPASTERDIIRRLDYAWGLSRVNENIHVHSTRNLILLRADMHRKFDHPDWALVPTRSTLNEIFSHTGLLASGAAPPYFRSRFPDTEWDYDFVLFRRSPVAFLRFSEDMESDTVHRYPFGDFGPIKSHIHPYFAIVNAAQKEIHYRKNVAVYLSDTPGSPPSRSLNYRESLQLCVLLYERWIPSTPSPLLGPPPQLLPLSQPPPPLRKRQKTEPVPNQVNTTQAPEPSGSNNGGSLKRGCEESALTCAHSLSTPEQPRRSTCDLGCRVETSAPKVERPMHHWTSVSSWVEDVKASAPLEDPHDTHSKHVDDCLTRYRGELAWWPRGPWEKWVPEYVLTD